MVTQPEKEDQILAYIEENCKNGRWSRITEREIIQKFFDQKFSRKVIKKILVDLIDNGVIKKKRLEYDFFCRTNMEYEVNKKLGDHTKPGVLGAYILSFFIYVLFLNIPSVFSFYTNFLKGEGEVLTSFDLLVYGFVMSFLIIWGIGYLFQKIWNFLNKTKNDFREYSWIGYPYVILAALVFLGFFIFGREGVSMLIIFLSGLTIVLAGTAINALIYQIKKDKRRNRN
ncbi:Uncharacterised protein [uncultured archaeon]|nr:Uncharacterised protein [uncultured archaeon]